MKEEIFLFYDERLPRYLIEAAERTIRDAGIIYHNTPVIHAGSNPLPGKKGSFFTNSGDVVRDNNGFGVQRDAGQMIEAIRKYLSRDGRRILFITICDLTCTNRGAYLNFCFGLAKGYSTVISMTRFGALPAQEQEIILAGLIMHELGHLYDVAADGSRKNTEDKIGMHCTDRSCVMRQGLSVEEIRGNFLFGNKYRKYLSDIRQKYYCALCAQDVDKHFEPKKANPKPYRPLPPRRVVS